MKLLWLDLETTGLDPEKCHIVEVAACVAELETPFDVRDPYEAVVRLSDVHHAIGDIGSERWCRHHGVHDVVRQMHEKNGLWSEIAQSSTHLGDAEDRLIAMAGETPASDRENQTTLAGSCVSFDLAFINRHMPRLAKFLHYRVLDVSSCILFARAMGMPRPPKVEAHRAMADVQESIANLRRCASYLASNWNMKPVELTNEQAMRNTEGSGAALARALHGQTFVTHVGGTMLGVPSPVPSTGGDDGEKR